MSRNNARNEWYVLAPEGGSQVIVHLDRALRMDAMTEEADYKMHLAVNDGYAGLIRLVQDGRVSPDVTADEAAAVVAAWDADADPDMVTVERIAS